MSGESLLKTVKDDLRSLYTYLTPHIKDNKIIKKLLADIEASDEVSETLLESIDQLYNIMCYTISESDIDGASQSLSIRNFDIGKLNRNIMYLINDYFAELTLPADKSLEALQDIFPECCELFKQTNATFLMPEEHITKKAELPKDAIIVVVTIKNCENMVFNMVPLIDRDYIKTNFADINDKSGLCKSIIARYKTLVKYDKLKQEQNYIFDELSDKYYQMLDEDNYRKLKPFHENDFTRNHEFINFNLYCVNWENKKIMGLRRNPSKDAFPVAGASVIGKIKSNIYEKRMRYSDAYYYARYNENMSDNEILDLLTGSFTFQESMPRDFKIADFGTKFNARNLP